MLLRIEVKWYKDMPPKESLSALFDQHGGTIGRKSTNNLFLPDPDKYISRKHVVITFENGKYYLTDTSLAGTDIVNKNLHVCQNRVEIADGDEIKIGEYDLIVAILKSQDNDELSSLENNFENKQSTFNTNQFDWSSKDPGMKSASLLKQNAAWLQSGNDDQDSGQNQPNEHYNQSAVHENFVQPNIAHAHQQKTEIPAGFNFKELLCVHQSDKKTEAPLVDKKPQPVDLFSPKINGVPEIEGAPSNTPLSGDVNNEPSPGQIVNKVDTAEKPAQAYDMDRQNVLRELFTIFLEGAGIQDDGTVQDEQIPELMQTVGTCMREIIAGLMTILRVRAKLKSDFHLSSTLIKSVKNNPLKFCPRVEDALQIMMTRNSPGFASPIDAIREGLNDIMNHQLAMNAGMQATVMKLIKQFDPQNFSSRYQDGIIFHKNSKCWEAYSRSYQQIADDARDNLCGEEFSRAYENQVRRLESHSSKTQDQ